MKLLIFGIDGGTRRILEAFDMPFTKSLFKDAREFETKDEDLFSRGWAEMILGKHAVESRAFYMGPLMDGTHSFSIAYKTDEAEAVGLTPIWKIAENAGSRVGIMNIPTTSPAKKVNGFMVGSGGGGLNKVSGIPDSLVYPPEAKKLLEDLGYIVDIRLTTSGIDDITTLFEQLARKEKLRADAYIELAKKYEIDFGFLVDRATTIVQYLCMSEIETHILRQSMSDQFENAAAAVDPIHGLLEEYYRSMDGNIRRLFESLRPENWIITADHSTVPYKYKGNVSPFLAKHGYLVERSKASPLKFVKRILLKGFPVKALKNVRDTVPKRIINLAHDTDWHATRAFGHDYIDGIYLNDSRFGGPVLKHRTESLVDEICEKFNVDDVAQDYSVTAKPYRRNFVGQRFSEHLPDIIFEKTDELHFVGHGDFIRANPNYGPIPELSEVKEDMFTGQKGRAPLLITNTELARCAKDDDKLDLTLVYKLAKRLCEDRDQT